MKEMGKGRWATVGCATLFAFPFCAAGLATIFSAPYSNGPDLAVRVAAGSVFVVAGLAIIFGSVVISGATAESFQLRQRYPDQPWLWRRDWSANAINDQGALWAGMIWTFAIIWNLICFPLLFVFPWKEVRDTPVVVVLFVFPAVGVLLLITALYKTLQRVKYGGSVCHIDQMPIVPGRSFHGEIETRMRDVPAKGVTLRLTCVRRTSSGRSTNETIIWQETQTVLATPSYEGAHVPFSFAIPADAEATQSVLGATHIAWRLEAVAEVPGVDYNARFDLPVFATGEKPPVAEPMREPMWPAPESDPSRWTPDPESHITVTPMPTGGEEFHVGPATTGRLGFILFTIIWFGILGVMVHFGAPLFVAIIFGLFGMVIVLIGIDWMLGRSVIRADRTMLSIRRTWLGLGSIRDIQPGDVTAITTAIGGAQNGVPLYHVMVRCGARSFAAAKYVTVKRDAEMVAARIRRAIGMGS